MEALFSSLVTKYGYEYAAKLLGLNKQTNNPKYTFGMPFTNQQISFDPLKSLGRYGLNKVMSGGISGIAVPAALLGGAVMLGRAFDPMRPGSRNYSPNLKGQIDYLSGISGMIGRDPNSGLMKYGPESVLRGQNVVNYFEDRIKKGKSINEERYEQAKKEKKDFFESKATIREKARQPKTTYTRPNMRDVAGGGGGGGNISGSVSRGGTDDTPGTPFRRGGIASLYG